MFTPACGCGHFPAGGAVERIEDPPTLQPRIWLEVTQGCWVDAVLAVQGARTAGVSAVVVPPACGSLLRVGARDGQIKPSAAHTDIFIYPRKAFPLWWMALRNQFPSGRNDLADC